MTAWRRLVLLLLLGLLLGMPDSARSIASLSLVKAETARSIDFDEDVVWFLVLGSDAREGTNMLKGNADVIQLIGVDFEGGTAVAFGVPRDSLVELERRGRGRINTALKEGGRPLMMSTIENLFGIAPDYVLTIGFGGFQRLVDAVGGIEVNSSLAFEEPASDLTVRKGPNQLDGRRALSYARYRDFVGDDFVRSANHQEMLKAILRQLIAHEDEEGFIERGARLALGSLDTNLVPTELYRLAQAVTQVDLDQVTTCVLSGTPGTEGPASIVNLEPGQARRLGEDARDDAHLERGCDG